MVGKLKTLSFRRKCTRKLSRITKLWKKANNKAKGNNNACLPHPKMQLIAGKKCKELPEINNAFLAELPEISCLNLYVLSYLDEKLGYVNAVKQTLACENADIKRETRREMKKTS